MLLPLRLERAGTVDKVQGKPTKKLEVHLLSSFFSHVQLYVALSRMSKHNDLILLHKQSDTLCNTSAVHNKIVTFANRLSREALQFDPLI